MSTAKKNDVFKYLKSINSGYDIEVEGDYSQYLTNRGLSLFLDSILFVNEINKYPDLDNQMHYDYLRSAINPKVRFKKWPKPQTHPQATVISRYFEISMLKAYDIIEFYSDQEIAEMLETVEQRDGK